MPPYFFYTTVQKVKNDQKLKSRGSCLISSLSDINQAVPSHPAGESQIH